MHQELIKLEKSFNKSILSQINDPFLESHNIQLWLKRDDLIHPIISGNKWRKLKYNLNEVLSTGKNTLISMGGAYSNHLHALAYIGKHLGLHTIGIIRGECPKPLTPTLQDVADWGMELRFISRSDFRLLRKNPENSSLISVNDHNYWLPEGGANQLALKGVGEIINEINIPYDIICVACGTGTTLAGLIENVLSQVEVLGFAALKTGINQGKFLHDTVKSLLTESNCHNWDIFYDYHCSGFAKINFALNAFITDFEEKTSIQLEPVYTGKMMYGIYDLIAKGYFKPGQRIIALHTGGLQGNRGYR